MAAGRGHWASAYLAREAGQDTLNLYETSAVAHAELIEAMRAGGASGVTESRAARRPAARSWTAASRALAATRSRAGVVYDDFDAAPHAFGLRCDRARCTSALTGDGALRRVRDRPSADWALGANAWGASLMIGVGTRFPRCPQHVVANLSGSHDGTRRSCSARSSTARTTASCSPTASASSSTRGSTCPRRGDRYAAYSGHGSRFVDDVRSWQTVEPAIDFTATAVLAFALSG